MTNINFGEIEKHFKENKELSQKELDFCIEVMQYNSQSSRSLIVKYLGILDTRLENGEHLTVDGNPFTKKEFATYISDNFSDYVFNKLFEKE